MLHLNRRSSTSILLTGRFGGCQRHDIPFRGATLFDLSDLPMVEVEGRYVPSTWAEAGPATDSRPAQLSVRAAIDAICLEASPPPILHPRKRGDENYPGCKPFKIHKTGK